MNFQKMFNKSKCFADLKKISQKLKKLKLNQKV